MKVIFSWTCGPLYESHYDQSHSASDISLQTSHFSKHTSFVSKWPTELQRITNADEMRSGSHYDWETKQHFCSWVQISWPSFAQYCIWTVAVYLYKQQDLNYNIWNYVMPCNRKYTSFFLTVAFAHWWQSYTPLTVCAIAAFHAFFDCSLIKFLKISKLSDYIFTE